jgi:hypothetical protein
MPWLIFVQVMRRRVLDDILIEESYCPINHVPSHLPHLEVRDLLSLESWP